MNVYTDDMYRQFLYMGRIYQYEYEFHLTCDVQANTCINRNNLIRY
jgi:hypothetical protein